MRRTFLLNVWGVLSGENIEIKKLSLNHRKANVQLHGILDITSFNVICVDGERMKIETNISFF